MQFSPKYDSLTPMAFLFRMIRSVYTTYIPLCFFPSLEPNGPLPETELNT